MQREMGLRIYKESGTHKGEVVRIIIINFYPESPLMMAQDFANTLVESAGCILPLTESDMITPDMGQGIEPHWDLPKNQMLLS